MSSCDFETTTHGKWILAGEHAVLRGHPALIFPLKEKKLTLRYDQDRSALSIDDANNSANMDALLLKVLEQGFRILQKPTEPILGQFQLQNTIPVGKGMGASAALCMAVSRWFVWKKSLAEQEVAGFARELEHLFHGKSSGLDIAGVAATSGLYFQQGITTPIEQTWAPKWFLSTCGEVGSTSTCISTVQELWNSNPQQAKQIDLNMHHCVLVAQSALKEKNIEQLAESINNAADCFTQWGLISTPLKQHMLRLREMGAIAVKPTGSGGGGYVLSLWERAPESGHVDFISV